VQGWNMQRELMFNSYTTLFWITHRNRFYTQATYPFLKNNIIQNEGLANAYLDSAIHNIDNNKHYNTKIFSQDYIDGDYKSVYHYKCVLYAYNLQIDSAQKYFDLLLEGAYFPYNNYGTFCAVQAKFSEAYDSYETASTQDVEDKRLQEWAYYSSIIDIYQGNAQQGAQLLQGMIQSNGSTPGFGWYNIAL
jgi:Tfp pilus assembly protein PilF